MLFLGSLSQRLQDKKIVLYKQGEFQEELRLADVNLKRSFFRHE